tara:strand:+ start:548 stop:775 length:228 start_codon:yes stop_codon:yes gene_type:complete
LGILKFKTNIKCQGCVASVEHELDKDPAIQKWRVDLEDPKRTLTIETSERTAGDMRAMLKKVGFEAETITDTNCR